MTLHQPAWQADLTKSESGHVEVELEVIVGALPWKILGTGAAVGAAVVARQVVTRGWTVATGKEPPTDPENPEVPWAEAVGWAVASSIVITVARVMATREAAKYYTKSSGHPPESELGRRARSRP